MRFLMKCIFALFSIVAAVSSAQTVAKSAPASEKPFRAELALDYSFLYSNAPPGGSTTFNLNGGSATVAWHAKSGNYAWVADVTVAHATSIANPGYTLTLGAYTVGVRYLPRMGHWPVRPFGQMLLGAAHTSGSLVQGRNPAAANAGAAFAANVGGGADLDASRRVSLRLVEADYQVTTFENGVNNHQNNLRLSTGVVFHF